MTDSDGKHVLHEVRRRRMWQTLALYIVGAWVALQVADMAFPAFDVPESAIRYVWIGAVAGLPIVLFLGWRYDFRGGRLVRTAAGSPDAIPLTRTDITSLGALALVAVAGIAFLVLQIAGTRIPVEPAREASFTNPNSIAVLPFVNLSEDPANEFFADGIAEEILNLLAKFPDLQVTSRSSAFAFKGQNIDIPTIADRLNVTFVLEGSVRKSGDRVRITAQLIEAESDANLWSETYDREFEDIFDIQDDISASIVQALAVPMLNVSPDEAATSPEVYALMLEAQYRIRNARSEDEFWPIVAQVEEALALDPDYAAGWSQLGNLIRNASIRTSLLTFKEGHDRAREAFQRALEADDRNGEAYKGLATVSWQYDWDFEAAEHYLDRALTLEPGNADYFRMAAELNRTLGRPGEAMGYRRKAMVLDPLYARGDQQKIAETLFEARRYEEAAEACLKALELGPQNYYPNVLLATIRLVQGETDAALAVVQDADLETRGGYFRHIAMALLHHALGDRVESDSSLEQWNFETGGKGPYQVAQVHAFRGDIDEAFAALDEAYDIRDNGMIYLLPDPLLDNLRDDPRWDAFVERVGLSPWQANADAMVGK